MSRGAVNIMSSFVNAAFDIIMQMKRYILPTLAGLAVALGMNAQAVDPVLMTVDSKPVHVSEFEYLYNKNNAQQQQPQTLDEYLDMFVVYKLKVADAEAAGIQDSPEFRDEFATFRRDLSKPYFRDQAVEDSLVNLAYSHRQKDVYVSHIMLPHDAAGKATADSLRAEIIAGTITFEDAARRFSVDRYSAERGGMMGLVMPDRFPWAFEEASYNTPVGSISEVVNSGLGFHIVRPESVNPAAGEVNASHILIMTRGKDEAGVAAAKARIDSLYAVVMAGGDFAELAKKYSEDPGSASKGGNLGYFGHGQMVSEFDSAAFALRDGEVSKPVKTAFGYHILRRNAHRGIEPLEKLRPEILQAMNNDSRASMPVRAVVDRIFAIFDAKVNPETFEAVSEAIAANGGVYDATVAGALASRGLKAATFADRAIMLTDVMAALSPEAVPDGEDASAMLRAMAKSMLEEQVLDYERDALYNTSTDYRNLVDEYRDGILLYEISNRNVWNRASKDTEGLNEFFRRNIERYRWDEPRYKAFVIFAPNDSVLNLAEAYANTLEFTDPADFSKQMRKRFGRDVKIERIVAAKGENKITDYLGFGGPKPSKDAMSRWPSYVAFRGKYISEAEEPADVRGAAVTDYQAELEQQWINRLRKEHKVKINQKVFKAVKEKNK